jgi:hypothetical protein
MPVKIIDGKVSFCDREVGVVVFEAENNRGLRGNTRQFRHFAIMDGQVIFAPLAPVTIPIILLDAKVVIEPGLGSTMLWGFKAEYEKALKAAQLD